MLARGPLSLFFFAHGLSILEAPFSPSLKRKASGHWAMGSPGGMALDRAWAALTRRNVDEDSPVNEFVKLISSPFQSAVRCIMICCSLNGCWLCVMTVLTVLVLCHSSKSTLSGFPSVPPSVSPSSSPFSSPSFALITLLSMHPRSNMRIAGMHLRLPERVFSLGLNPSCAPRRASSSIPSASMRSSSCDLQKCVGICFLS